jgi:hypothetical protein
MSAMIDSLLATKDGIRRSEVNSLGPDDIADLAARAANPFDPNSLRALNNLAAVALNDQAVAAVLSPVVDLVLGRPDLDPLTRASVLSFATVAHLDALTRLLAATAHADSDVAAAAWRALQLVARSADLDALQQAQPPPGAASSEQAAFTVALVAYRGGVAGFELPVLDETHIRAIPNDEVQLFSITQSATTAEDFALIAALSATEMYLVAAQIDATTTITCGEQHMLLCLDPDLLPAMPGTLIQSPAMAGVIAVRDPFATGFAVRFLLLTHPDGTGGFHVGIYQAGGELMYQGHAQGENVAENSATLALFALDQPGVRPIALDISVGPGGVDLLGDRLSAMEVLTDPMEPTPGEF